MSLEFIALQFLLSFQVSQLSEPRRDIPLAQSRLRIFDGFEQSALLALDRHDLPLESRELLAALSLRFFQRFVVPPHHIGERLLTREPRLELLQEHPLHIVGVEGPLRAGFSAFADLRVASVIAIPAARAVRSIADEAGTTEHALHQAGEQVVTGDGARMFRRALPSFQKLLHSVPCLPIHDGLMGVLDRDRLQLPVDGSLALVEPLAERRIPTVLLIAQDPQHEVSAEGIPASILHALGVEPMADGVGPGAFDVHREDPAHDLGFGLFDGELALWSLLGLHGYEPIAERCEAAVPPPVPGILRHALEALPREVEAVELVHAFQHGLKQHFSWIAGSEDRLGGRHDPDAFSSENVLVLDGVVAVTGEPVELVD